MSYDGEAVVASDTAAHTKKKMATRVPVKNCPVLHVNEALHEKHNVLSRYVVLKLTWDNNDPFFCLKKKDKDKNNI